MPRFASKYGGDALWAALVFMFCAAVLNRASTRGLTLLSLLIAWTVEFSQLYRAPWADAIRSTRLGHLVFGYTFNAPDLLAYAVGILIAALVDKRWRGSVAARPR
jgi:hypothetical protein